MFKITYDDSGYGIYKLKAYKKEIKERYSTGKKQYIGDRCDGNSMISVVKTISNLEFLN